MCEDPGVFGGDGQQRVRSQRANTAVMLMEDNQGGSGESHRSGSQEDGCGQRREGVPAGGDVGEEAGIPS